MSGTSDPLPDPFDELAARVADGDPIDWQALGASRRFQGNELAALKLIGQLRLTPDVALVSPGEILPPPTGGVAPPTGGVASPATRGGPPLEQGFELIAELGKGAFATVWRARDKALGREVALKLLNERTLAMPAARARFLAEARLLASLDHPNIVRIHSIDEHDGKLRLSLELLDGQTLDQWLRSSGPLSAAEAARIGADLCRALAAIHGQGLVHGDVKPANVMRAANGRIVLLDFGIARTARTPQDLQRADAAGTPLYMAPEQFRDPPHAGPRSDLFALGVLLYWLVARRHPVEAESIEELVEAMRAGKLVPLVDRCPDVAPEFAAIVDRALAHDEAGRFESAGAMERALARFSAGGAAFAAGAAPDRRPLWLAAAAVVVIGGLAWGWFGRSGAADRRGGVAVGEAPLLVGRPAWLRVGGGELHDRDEVRVGDDLQLELQAAQKAWVYVVNQDGAGTVNVLFPTSGTLLANPIAPGLPMSLPGHRRPAAAAQEETLELGAWRITESPAGGGSEDFFVVVASAPYPPLEEFIAKLPQVGALLGELDARTVELASRGIGLAPPEAKAGGAAAKLRLRDELQKIAATDREQGVRIERYFLRLQKP